MNVSYGVLIIRPARRTKKRKGKFSSPLQEERGCAMVRDTQGPRHCGLGPDQMELKRNVPTEIQGSGEEKAPEGRNLGGGVCSFHSCQ